MHTFNRFERKNIIHKVKSNNNNNNNIYNNLSYNKNEMNSYKNKKLNVIKKNNKAINLDSISNNINLIINANTNTKTETNNLSFQKSKDKNKYLIYNYYIQQDKKYDFEFIITLLGNSHSGQTCLSHRYTEDEFEEKPIPIIGAAYKQKLMLLDKYKIKIHI